MNLIHLRSAPHITVYFDSWNNWLYLEWEGALTLPAVQHACLEIARCFINYTYPRVLNSDAQVTSLPWAVAPWLAKHFLPGLQAAGIEQLAWVHAPNVRGHSLAMQVVQQLPMLHIGLFSDIEQATNWLQYSNFAYKSGGMMLPRVLAERTRVARVVEDFRRYLATVGESAAAAVHA